MDDLATPPARPTWIEGALIKLHRANQHIDDLERRENEYFGWEEGKGWVAEKKPWSGQQEIDPATGAVLMRYYSLREPPRELGAIFGDAAHNLRSALDTMVWQGLLSTTGKKPGKWVAFPILETVEKLGEVLDQIGALSPTIRDFIAAAKPYRGGNDALWTLAELNNGDKHEVLTPVVAHAQPSVGFDLGPMGIPFEFGVIMAGYTVLKDGDVLRSPMTPPDDPRVKVGFRLDLAFDAVRSLQPRPMVQVLRSLSIAVADLVARFGALPLGAAGA
jgi:hypothetical protein